MWMMKAIAAGLERGTWRVGQTCRASWLLGQLPVFSGFDNAAEAALKASAVHVAVNANDQSHDLDFSKIGFVDVDGLHGRVRGL